MGGRLTELNILTVQIANGLTWSIHFVYQEQQATLGIAGHEISFSEKVTEFHGFLAKLLEQVEMEVSCQYLAHLPRR